MAFMPPLFVTETNAARIVDMKPAEFRELVKAGSLPSPCLLSGKKRWDVEELCAVMRGKKPKLDGGLDL